MSGREYRRDEMCLKCGDFPQPIWVNIGNRDLRCEKSDASEEHLSFMCPCSFHWTTPPRDDGTRNVQGILVPKGYDLVRDDKAPACPAGFRIVPEGGR